MAVGAFYSIIVSCSANVIGCMQLNCIIYIVILTLMCVSGFSAVNPLRAVNMSSLLAVVEFIRSGRIILGAVTCVVGAGVPIGIKFAAVCSSGSLVSLIAVFYSVAVTCFGQHHAVVVGNFRIGSCILKELTAGAIVVFLITVGRAGSFLSVHLGKMGRMHMTGCSLHHEPAFRAGLRRGFGCGRSCRVRYYVIMVIRIASAYMSVTVGFLIAPLRSVEIVVVIECSVRNTRNGIVVRIKQISAKSTRLIGIPAFICTG